MSEFTSEVIAGVFSDAADHIERYGWWRGGEDKEESPLAACLWTATTYGASHRGVRMTVENTETLIRLLTEHFELESDVPDGGFESVLDLNDAQPAETGKQWAIHHLEAISRKALTS